jgi:hypothetical protein
MGMLGTAESAATHRPGLLAGAEGRAPVDQLAVARRGGKLLNADWLSWRDVDVATMTYSAVVAVVFAPLVVGVVLIAASSRRARRHRSRTERSIQR